MGSTLDLLRRLTEAKVDYVLVGGMAAIAHGASTVTEDADICINFDLATLTAAFKALEPLHPRQRMNPAKPPLGTDPAPFVGYKNLYLLTDDGVLDLLGEVVAVGGYERVAARAVELDLGAFRCRVMGLDDLIECKRALGRPKDVRAAAELDRVRARVQPK
ncbi:MAG: hypothetical protein QM723_21090 [Myxococcaceae bacterium]